MNAPAGLLARWKDRCRAEFASRLARNSLLVFGMSVLGRGLALGKEVLVAALFGVGTGLDAYVLALLLPGFLANQLGWAWGATLVTALGKGGGRGEPTRAGRLLRRGLGMQFLVLAGACLALALLPDGAFLLLAPRAAADTLALARALLNALLPLFVLASLNSSLAALSNLRGEFRGPALASAAGAALSLPLVFLMHDAFGPHALAYAVDAGAALEFLLLLPTLRRVWGEELRAVAGRGSPPTRGDTVPLAGPWAQLALGQALLGLTAFVDNAVASSLGPGAVSALSYAAKLPSGVAGLLGLTLSTVLLPHFATLAHTAEPTALAASCRRVLRRVALLAAPIALAGALASPWLVQTLFQRGRFDAGAAALVAAAQAWYFLQLPAYLLSIAATRMLQALLRLRFLLWLQAALLVLGGLASLGLGRLFGVAGIAAASVCMYLFATTAMLCALRRAARGEA